MKHIVSLTCDAVPSHIWAAWNEVVVLMQAERLRLLVRTSIVTRTRAAERMSHVFVTLAVAEVTVGHARGGKHKFWI
jgi:hypothetical protein